MKLRGPEAHTIATLRTLGEERKAEELLATLNRVQAAFGRPPFDMPEPYRTDLPDLVTADARPRRRILRIAA